MNVNLNNHPDYAQLLKKKCFTNMSSFYIFGSSDIEIAGTELRLKNLLVIMFPILIIYFNYQVNQSKVLLI